MGLTARTRPAWEAEAGPSSIESGTPLATTLMVAEMPSSRVKRSSARFGTPEKRNLPSGPSTVVAPVPATDSRTPAGLLGRPAAIVTVPVTTPLPYPPVTDSRPLQALRSTTTTVTAPHRLHLLVVVAGIVFLLKRRKGRYAPL